MKKSLQVLISLALAFALIENAQATTLYWNGATAGSGAWDTTTTIWSSTSAGALDTIWNNSADGGDDAVFTASSTAYTVTIASGTNINVHNLTFNNCGVGSAYTISGTGATLTLVGSSPTIYSGTTSSLFNGVALRVALAGASGFTKTGYGYVDLFGTSVYSGTTYINEGAVNAQVDAAFGTSAVVISNGGWLWYWGDNGNRTYANNITFSGSGSTTSSTYAVGAVQLRGAATKTFNGTVIGNSGTFFNSGAGLVTFNGSVILNNSVFNSNNNGGSVTMNGLVVVSGTSSITVGNSWAQSLTVYNSIVGSGATLAMSLTGNASRNHLVTGSIDLGADGVLTKNLTGILTIGGTSDSRASSWGTLKITEGTVQIGNGAGSPALSAAAQSSNIIISYTGYSGSNYNGRLQFNSAGSYNLSGSISGTTAGTYSSSSFAGGIYLAATNTGTVTLSGTNTYTGQTYVGGGVLRTTNSSALGASSAVLLGGTGSSSVNLAGDVALANKFCLAGRSTTAADIISESGNNSISGDIQLLTSGSYYSLQSNSGTLNVNTITNVTASTGDRYVYLAGDGDGVVKGSISNNATTTGTVSLFKTGAGRWTLTGASAYAGKTTVNAGTLAVNGGISSQVVVNSGAKLVGAGAIGALTAASGGTVSAGDGLGILTVNGSASLAGDLIAEISGNTAGTGYDQLVVSGDVILSGTLSAVVAGGFTASDADLLWIVVSNSSNALGGTFSNYADGATVFTAGTTEYKIHYGADYATGSLTGGNDVVLAAVPEPGMLALLAVAGLAALAIRRRRG